MNNVALVDIRMLDVVVKLLSSPSLLSSLSLSLLAFILKDQNRW